MGHTGGEAEVTRLAVGVVVHRDGAADRREAWDVRERHRVRLPAHGKVRLDVLCCSSKEWGSHSALPFAVQIAVLRKSEDGRGGTAVVRPSSGPTGAAAAASWTAFGSAITCSHGRVCHCVLIFI